MNNNSFERNIKIFPYLFASTFTPMYLFSIIYFVFITESYLLATTIFAVIKISNIIMEVPTGIISDKYLGRKGTYLFGQFFLILAYICYLCGFFNYLFLIIGGILEGITKALHSGNTNSLLYDSLKQTGEIKKYRKRLAKANGYMNWGLGFSSIIAGLFSLISIYYVLIISIIYVFIGFILGLFIKEPFDFKTGEKHTLKTNWEHLKKAGHYFIINPKLRFLAIISILRSSFIYSVDQIGFVFYKKFFSIIQISFIFSISSMIVGTTAYYSDKILTRFGILKTFLRCEFLATTINSLAYLFPTPVSPFMIEASANVIAIEEVAEETLLHDNYSDNQRATMGSLISIVGAGVYAIFVLLIGYMADLWSIETALLIAVLCRLLLIPFYFKLYKHD